MQFKKFAFVVAGTSNISQTASGKKSRIKVTKERRIASGVIRGRNYSGLTQVTAIDTFERQSANIKTSVGKYRKFQSGAVLNVKGFDAFGSAAGKHIFLYAKYLAVVSNVTE